MAGGAEGDAAEMFEVDIFPGQAVGEPVVGLGDAAVSAEHFGGEAKLWRLFFLIQAAGIIHGHRSKIQSEIIIQSNIAESKGQPFLVIRITHFQINARNDR